MSAQSLAGCGASPTLSRGRRARFHRLRVFAIAVVLSGCSFAGANEGPAVINSCLINAECGSNQVCDPALAACVSAERADYDVVLRVTAPASEAFLASPPTRFGPMAIEDAITTRALEVRGTQRVTGLLAVRSDGDETPLNAEVLLTPVLEGPGPTPETISVTSSQEYRGGGAQDANFATALLPDTDYIAEAKPLGEAQVRVSSRKFELSADAIASGHVELIYDALEPVTGQLLSADGTPMAGVRVRAVHPDSAEVISGRAISGSQGEFELSVDESRQADDALPWAIQVGPSSELPWFPTWTAEAQDTVVSEGTRVIVRLPHLPALVPVEVVVESEPETNVLRGVGGAEVNFSATLELLRRDGSPTQASVSHGGITSEQSVDEGQLALELLEGSYEVVATPPSDRIGLTHRRVGTFPVVAQLSGGVQRGGAFLLPSRTSVMGVAEDSAGRVLPGVRVNAARLEPDSDLPKVAVFSRDASTASDLDGLYELRLDRGAYDVAFDPGENVAHPWRVIAAERIDSGSDRSLDVQLGPAVVLMGEVSFADGRPSGGAVVSAFAEFEDSFYGARYLQIGRATVMEDGSYQLYLPRSL